MQERTLGRSLAAMHTVHLPVMPGPQSVQNVLRHIKLCSMLFHTVSFAPGSLLKQAGTGP
jgi:hypothetical protein